MRVDHLLYTVPDLALGMEQISELVGVEVVRGGRHPSFGTANALIGLGSESYLEIIGPDPAASDPTRIELLGMDFSVPRLGTWVAKARLRGGAVDRIPPVFGAVIPGQRDAPDGTQLSWLFTDPSETRFDGVVPFLIDWIDTPHPALALKSRCQLLDFRIEHPTPRLVEDAVGDFDGGISVTAGTRPSLHASISTPAGVISLS